MQVPPWLTILVGAMVTIFGAYRIWLALKKDARAEAERRRGSIYGYPRRTHFLIGVVYIVLGGFLILTALGVRFR